MTENKKITIIGGGNLGGSIAKGLTACKTFKEDHITVTNLQLEPIAELAKYGLHLSTDNVKAAENADIIIIAVKPNHVKGVLKEIMPVIENSDALLISVATGVKTWEIEEIVGVRPIIRVMPNTAISIQESFSCITERNASQEQIRIVENIFRELGMTLVIREELMPAATVLGSCGIAFALRFMRAASQGGIEIGFSAQHANKIAAQTLKGAAELILQSGFHPEHEIDKVTTPKGITISGLNEMEFQGFSSSLIKGLMTSYEKIQDLEKD